MRALSSRNLRGTSNGRGSDNASRSRFHSAGARLDVLDRAGEGTLFVTYRVRDKNLDRVLALKALKNAYSKHAQFAPVLAAGAAKLLELPYPAENSHVAQLFEIGEEEGTTFLVTEWLAGQSLEARLRRAPFGRIESLTSTRQIAHGLKLLHENGIVHGDLRPRQVLGSADGLLKITDAGMSEAFATAGLSVAEVLPDSIYYLAPERTLPNIQSDAPATIAGDLYAMGAILYRMLSGRVPFAGPSPVAVAMRHRHDEPLPPSRYNLQCPPDLEAIALRLLAKNPDERFTSAQEVLNALEPQPQVVTPVASTPVASTSIAALPVVKIVEDEPDAAQTPFAATSSTRSDDAASDAAANSANVSTSQNIAPTPNLFPANLPISALAAAPLSQIAATPVVSAPVVATAAIATPVIATTAAASAAASTVSPSAMTNATTSTRSGVSAPVSSINSASTVAAVGKSPAPITSAPVSPQDDEKKARKKQKRREFWGAFWALLWVFIGLGMFIGIFFGAYYLWDQGKPKSVSVPSYIGKSQARATADLKQRGLALGDVSEVFDPKRAAGTVINGNPRPGRQVKIGREVSLTVSRGAEQISMPDFSDLNVTQVRQVLARSGIKLGNITEIYNERVAKGYVCGQFPSPGEAFSRSEAINLVVSRGAQPIDDTKPTGDLLPPPPPLSTSTSTEDNPLTTANATPKSGDGSSDGDAPLVSRTALVRVPVPAKAPGNTSERNVKIEVRDANGTNVIYEAPHLPGELIDEYVRVTRPQGSSATISIYIDGQLQKQQKV